MMNMNDETLNFEEGFDVEEPMQAENVVEMKQPKRLPFATWNVRGVEYKLKLTASVICKLEQKFKRNLLIAITEDGIPPIAVMLTVLQAAMQQYHHGVTYITVQNIYDNYIDEGGDQNKLMSEVIMPLLGASGFFTTSQMEILTKEMSDMDAAL